MTTSNLLQPSQADFSMKWILRLLTLCSVVAIITLPLYMDRLSGLSGLPFTSSQKTGFTSQSISLPTKSTSQEIYKWRDSNGVWQYSDEPPAAGTQVVKIEVSNQTNIIQAVPVLTEPEPPNPREHISDQANQTLEETDQQELLSLDRAKNILNEAKAVRELMETRNQHLENITGDGNKR